MRRRKEETLAMATVGAVCSSLIAGKIITARLRPPYFVLLEWPG
jgi:hypothetical protein